MNQGGRLGVVLVANLALVAGLVVVGAAAHSVGVWAEGVDDLGDAAAIGAALFALRVEAPTQRRPEGRPRATRQVALVNASWLLVLTAAVVAVAADRLATGIHDVHGVPVLVASGVTAAVMAAGALLLARGPAEAGERPDEGGALGVRAVLLDTVADAAGASGVAVAGAVIAATGSAFWLDPAVALVIGAVVGFHALRLLVRVRASLRSRARGVAPRCPPAVPGRARRRPPSH